MDGETLARLMIDYDIGVDLGSELWGEVYEPLRDPEFFKRFAIDPAFHTLVWPNDIDIAPEFLHHAVRATT